jgi:DNA-binding NtrC family response regulator
MDKPRVLIVDDEPGVRESLRLILSDRAETASAESGEQALERIAERRFDVVLLDIIMPGIDGMEVLERIKDLAHPPQVVMLTATRTVKTAVQAMKLGAFDYITKPFDIDEIQLAVERAAERSALREEVQGLRREVGRRYRFENVIGNAEAMRQVLDTVSRVARSKTTVLITGESGTGKEVIARAIHFNSPRAERPLVTLNCAAIPDNLLESELFGHERGAFTDAHSRKEGQFENADRGTIFLDEIGEMNSATQAKILRVLEQGTFTRVGSTQEVRVDVRVIAATNRDLHKAMEEGVFRPDLYFRLNVVAIQLPPLRERMEDLPLLVRHFLTAKARDLELPEKPFTGEALDILMRYNWPGNVRQLENVVERALVLSRGPELGAEDLPGEVLGHGTIAPTAAAADPVASAKLPADTTLEAAVDELETHLIRRALEQADLNQTRAAEILGTTRRILKYKMDKLGIAESPPQEDS